MFTKNIIGQKEGKKVVKEEVKRKGRCQAKKLNKSF